MNYEREIIKNLMDYLISGNIDGTSVEQFDGIGFPADSISGKRFKFYTKYEQVESITDNSIIPVLFITIPDKYKEGEVLYNGALTDLKTLLVSDEYPKKINFFVVPQVSLLSGNRLGSIDFVIDVDYVSDYDIYGFIADEISQLVKLIYYKKRSGDYYHMKMDDNRDLFFVPESIEKIDSGAILVRLKHRLNVKGCHFA